MKAWTFIIFIFIAGCSINLAGKQTSQPDMTCEIQGGGKCPDGLLCSGQLLDSSDGGLQSNARCCVFGSCEKAISPDVSIHEESSLIDTDINCNVHTYHNGLITVYASDLIRRGHHQDETWQEDSPIDVSNIAKNARVFSIQQDSYLLVQGIPPIAQIASITANILRFVPTNSAIRLENGKWSYFVGKERVGNYFSTPYPRYAEQSNSIYFSDSQQIDRLILFNKETLDTSEVAIGFLDNPSALTASETHLFAADNRGIEVFDTENFRFLMRYPLSFKVDDLKFCGGSLYALGDGKLIKLDTTFN